MTRIDEVLGADDQQGYPALPTLSRHHAPESRAADIVAERVLIGRFRYAPGLGWLAWDGTRWDDDLVAEECAVETVRRFIDQAEKDTRAQWALLATEHQALAQTVLARVPPEARTGEGSDQAEGALFAEHATDDEKEQASRLLEELEYATRQADLWKNLLSAAKISALVRLCRAQPCILTRADAFDARPDLLNAGNGVVDLRTGELLPHDPDLLLTHIAGGDYLPGATHPLWGTALEAIPTGIRGWAQTRLGQSITGHTPDDDALVLAEGGGENGKSALMAAVMRAAGSYGRLISHRVLLPQAAGQHPTELMDLRGLRFALLEETPEEGRLDTHQLKTTIGTPQITARRMRRDDVTFDTTHSLWVNTNYPPQVDTTDHGTWRRLKAMQFPYRFLKPGQHPENDNDRPGDPTLKPRLASHEGVAEAVLAWLVAGAQQWYRNDRIAPPDPPEIVEATTRWRASSDVGLQFAQESLITDAHAFITAGDMRAAFTAFLRAQGKPEWSAKTINTRLGPSMRAAGVMVQSDPTTQAKVRAKDQQSSLPGLHAAATWGAPPHPPSTPAPAGAVVRMWRGVRFRTSTERQQDDNPLRIVPNVP